jgi:hypothetical protein
MTPENLRILYYAHDPFMLYLRRKWLSYNSQTEVGWLVDKNTLDYKLWELSSTFQFCINNSFISKAYPQICNLFLYCHSPCWSFPLFSNPNWILMVGPSSRSHKLFHDTTVEFHKFVTIKLLFTQSWVFFNCYTSMKESEWCTRKMMPFRTQIVSVIFGGTDS